MGWIDKFGVELEGGWDKPAWKDACIIADDSLPASVPCNWTTGNKSQHWGEIVSPPMDLSSILAWTKDHYPNGGSERCSMHVHVSTKSTLAYAELANISFYNKFLKDMKKWRDNNLNDMTTFDRVFFDQRLNGQNKYCKLAFRPSRQMFRVVKHPHVDDQARRSILNYPWALHGTLEVRLMPLFQRSKLALSAINAISDCIEEYLAPGKWETPTRRGKILFKDLEAVREANLTLT